jgi:hypothetical protein
MRKLRSEELPCGVYCPKMFIHRLELLIYFLINCGNGRKVRAWVVSTRE